MTGPPLSDPYFTEEDLKSVKIYQLDFDRYCEEWGIYEHTQSEAVDTSGLEAQLAEAQAKFDEKDALVADLQAQLAELRKTSAELAKTTRTQAGAIGKLKKDLESWKAALPMAAKASAAVIAAGKALRSREELRTICEGCGVTPDCKYLCEPKRADQIATDEVQAKARAATTWCQHATEHAQKYGGKPWRYLLVAHDRIQENMTLKGLEG